LWDQNNICGNGFISDYCKNPVPNNLTKQNKTKQNKTKQNKTKQNKTKPNKTKQNKTKQNKTKQNKTKQNKTKQNKSSKKKYRKIGRIMSPPSDSRITISCCFSTSSCNHFANLMNFKIKKGEGWEGGRE
jgi:ATPase subunit of ABC transporter with duplicated ATPase domains